MKNNNPESMNTFEKWLLSLGAPPWDSLYRTAIGFVTLPAMSRLLPGNRSRGWILVPFLLTVLVTVRIVPAIARRLVPVSEAVQAVWSDRRQIYKRYDSHQWQKLFWVGLGLGAYTAISGDFSVSAIVVSAFCLFTGGIGFIRWREHRPSDRRLFIDAHLRGRAS